MALDLCHQSRYWKNKRMRIHPLASILYLLIRVVNFFDHRQRDMTNFNPMNIRRILVVSTTALGDTVMSTGGMHAIRQRYPKAHIGALLHPLNGMILRYSEDFDEPIYYNGRYSGFLRVLLILRQRRFDMALIFHGNDPQITPLLYFSCIPFIFKLPNNNEYGFLLSNRTPVVKKTDFSHALKRRAALAVLAGSEKQNLEMNLNLSIEQRRGIEDLFKKIGIDNHDIIVGFQVGASKKNRMWPEYRFVELGRSLKKLYPGIKIILPGTRKEKEKCDSIAFQIGSNAYSVAGLVELEALPALIGRMDVLVTGDTGTMHVAIAVRTPTVSLFVVSNPADTGPIYDLDIHKVIHKPRSSSNQNIMECVQVNEVLVEIEAILLSYSPSISN